MTIEFSFAFMLTVSLSIAGVIMMAIGYKEILKVKRANAISKSVPGFISTLIETMKTGQVLSRAIIIVSTSTNIKYISPLLKIAAERIKKGMSVGKALDIMARDLGNDLFTHVASVVSKIEETGGDVTEILRKLSDFVEATVKASTRRSSDMASYATVLFISFGVMLFTLLLAVVMIFPKLMAASAIKASTFGISATALTLVTWSFFIVAEVYSATNGLNAGIFLSGNAKAGFFYGGILAAATAVVFYVFSGGVV